MSQTFVWLFLCNALILVAPASAAPLIKPSRTIVRLLTARLRANPVPLL